MRFRYANGTWENIVRLQTDVDNWGFDPIYEMNDFCECGCPKSSHVVELVQSACMRIGCDCMEYRQVDWSGLYSIPEEINTKYLTEDTSYDQESSPGRD